MPASPSNLGRGSKLPLSTPSDQLHQLHHALGRTFRYILLETVKGVWVSCAPKRRSSLTSQQINAERNLSRTHHVSRVDNQLRPVSQAQHQKSLSGCSLLDDVCSTSPSASLANPRCMLCNPSTWSRGVHPPARACDVDVKKGLATFLSRV